jgi:hypothetical protein
MVFLRAAKRTSESAFLWTEDRGRKTNAVVLGLPSFVKS